MYTVFGAGSVGTVLAGLLSGAGVPVAIAGRNAVGAIRLEGDDEEVVAQVPVVDEPEGTILLCVHEPDVAELCARWRGRTVVTFQNGIRSEAIAAQHCHVIGGVWRMTCTLVEPGLARFVRRGRVIVGRHPSGVDGEVRQLAGDLAAAGLDATATEQIAAEKWLKLFINLTSAPHALIRKADHATPEFTAVKVGLLEEARAALEGVVPRDAMDLEIERQRVAAPRARPVYNATWRQLSLGRRPKERYHDLIAGPKNAAMLRLLDEAAGPECYGAAEVLAAISGT